MSSMYLHKYAVDTDHVIHRAMIKSDLPLPGKLEAFLQTESPPACDDHCIRNVQYTHSSTPTCMYVQYNTCMYTLSRCTWA